MKSCVFDIETAPLADRDIPPALVTKLRESEGSEGWRQRLGLYAPAASVIVIGMLNPETRVGEVLYDNRYGPIESLRAPSDTVISVHGGSEETILERFWSVIGTYDRVITYNGRIFDVPFLMQRSLIRNLAISRNLITGRQPEHVDLAEILTLRRATRMYGLGIWAQAIGAPSPKEGAVSGPTVHEVFAMRRTKEIAEYCLGDVQATATLAERVLNLWRPLLG